MVAGSWWLVAGAVQLNERIQGWRLEGGSKINFAARTLPMMCAGYYGERVLGGATLCTLFPLYTLTVAAGWCYGSDAIWQLLKCLGISGQGGGDVGHIQV